MCAWISFFLIHSCNVSIKYFNFLVTVIFFAPCRLKLKIFNFLKWLLRTFLQHTYILLQHSNLEYFQIDVLSNYSRSKKN